MVLGLVPALFLLALELVVILVQLRVQEQQG